MEFTRATVPQIPAVLDVIGQCREMLTAQGILQWDAAYPNRAFFQQATDDGTLFVLMEAEVVRGVVVLDQWQPPEWDAINWGPSTGRCLVPHALAVAPVIQGRGYGTTLLAFCEAFAGAGGYESIRLDAYSGNDAALRLYERHGYSLRGEIALTVKPEGHERYLCYEKLLAAPAGAAE